MARAENGTTLELADELSELTAVVLRVSAQLGAANLALDRIIDDLRPDLDRQEIIEVEDALMGLQGILQGCMRQLLAGCDAADEKQVRSVANVRQILNRRDGGTSGEKIQASGEGSNPTSVQDV